jgi:hypothetical protein
MDLLAVLIQEYFTFVLRIAGILHDINVAVVRKFTLTVANNFLIRFMTTVPQFVVGSTDRTLITFRSGAVLNQPTTWTLESVVVNLRPGYALAFGSGEETDNGVAVTRSVKLGLPEPLVGTTG